MLPFNCRKFINNENVFKKTAIFSTFLSNNFEIGHFGGQIKRKKKVS